MKIGVDILNFKNFPNYGLIATIKFQEAIMPRIDDIIEFEGRSYKIEGILVTSNSKVLNSKFDNGIFDCKIVPV